MVNKPIYESIFQVLEKKSNFSRTYKLHLSNCFLTHFKVQSCNSCLTNFLCRFDQRDAHEVPDDFEGDDGHHEKDLHSGGQGRNVNPFGDNFVQVSSQLTLIMPSSLNCTKVLYNRGTHPLMSTRTL